MGLIVCGDSALASIVSSEFIPTEFWPSLQTLRHMCSRSKQMDVRQITGHFLAYAVDIARRLFNLGLLSYVTYVRIRMIGIIGSVRIWDSGPASLKAVSEHCDGNYQTHNFTVTYGLIP